MTNQDRRTLASLLKAQADQFGAAGARDIARGLRRRAAEALEGLHCIIDVAAAPRADLIPVRVRTGRRTR